MAKDGNPGSLDLIWGAEAIAREINQDLRKTYYLLESGKLRCAKKIGDRWISSKRALRREFADVLGEAS